MWPWLPEAIALPLLPLLSAQGKRTRRITPRMPEAAGPRSGLAGATVGSMAPLSMLSLGESPVAGVGVALQEQAITAQFAQALAERLQRAVAWQACGKNGATIADALAELVPQLPAVPVQMVLLAFGVNDTTAFRSNARYREHLHQLLQTLTTRLQPALIVVAGVPPLHLFPALPQPLRFVLGLKARCLDQTTRQLAAAFPGTLYVPVVSDNARRELMAADGYHPSRSGVIEWAQQLTAAAAPLLKKLT
ncbi:SGNH/GDSL hydrolase family protein [Herbaspirillum autotrophicum]|uniref:SGNH/GDSL hydrolase family protein n=1 Tax=Herbaspirillum autotrophicum TaxID=180195 RepID=UPI00067C8BC9|nr:SGNH/GDSL hydrolase family protein [Herbaspirillum autotrophicum]